MELKKADRSNKENIDIEEMSISQLSKLNTDLDNQIVELDQAISEERKRQETLNHVKKKMEEVERLKRELDDLKRKAELENEPEQRDEQK